MWFKLEFFHERLKNPLTQWIIPTRASQGRETLGSSLVQTMFRRFSLICRTFPNKYPIKKQVKNQEHYCPSLESSDSQPFLSHGPSSFFKKYIRWTTSRIRSYIIYWTVKLLLSEAFYRGFMELCRPLETSQLKIIREPR